MKKRILSIIVCLAMMVTTFAVNPMMTSATDTETSETVLPPAVNYTNAAPFLDPVEGEAESQIQTFALRKSVDSEVAAVATDTDNNGLITNKVLTQNEEGDDILRLEAWTTGSKVTTTVSESVPTDIILVLDQSGSMNFCMYENCNSQSCSGKHNVTTYTYKETTTLNSDSNTEYYYNDNGIYKRIYYCRGDYWSDCDKGWYTQQHGWNNGHSGDLITPKTNDNPSGTQCYTRTQQSTSQTFDKRIDALSAAAENFVESVYEKAAGADKDLSKTDDNVDHRIAVVGFASKNSNGNNTEILSVAGNNSGSVGVKYNSLTTTTYKNALQKVSTTAGQTMVSNAVDALAASGATQINLGIEMANNIFANNPIGQDEKRNRVVIVFTDGSPTSESGFEDDVANSAIDNSKTTKNTHKATVYSIGIFGGADGSNPASLPANNNTGSNQENRFMHLVSSNYPNATNMTTPGDINANLKGNSYYLSANNSEALNDIFEQISSEIESGKPPITLTETAVVQDVISEQFQLPEGTKKSDIKVYTAEYQAENSFKEPVEYNATVDISGDRDEIITVTNFDFTENWVGTETVNGIVTYRGNKLIIEIPIEVREDFLGGNNVLTNAEGSGVYEDHQSVKDKDPIEEFNSPKTDVEIKKVEVTAPDQNVYLTGTVTEETILSDLVVKCGNVTLDMDEDNYGLESWQTAYVTIGDDDSVTNYNNLTDDTTYNATVTVTPNTTGTSTAQSGAATGNIYVFKPEVTFSDGNVYLGGTTPAEHEAFKGNVGEVVWKHGDVVAPDSMGDAPGLSYTFDKINTEVLSTEDIPVNVNVAINGTDVTSHVNGGALVDKAEFDLHVFSPYVDFNDSNVYFGAETPTDFTDNTGAVTWKRGDTIDTSVTMLGSKPDVNYTYTVDSSCINDGVVNATSDVPVNVCVKAGNVTVNEDNLGHNPCGGIDETLPNGAEFLLHVFSPYVSFNDTDVYYGAVAPNTFDENTSDVTWKRDGVKAPASMGTAPNVNITYDYLNKDTAMNADKRIVTTGDVAVDATVKVGALSVPEDNIDRTNCDGENSIADGADFVLHVLTPSVAFNDTYVYYGDTAPTNFAANTGEVTWGKDGVKSGDVIGTAPVIDFNYNYVKSNDVVDNIISVRIDIPVNVVATAGGIGFPEGSFSHVNCNGAATEEREAGSEFELHVNTCTLKIAKTGIDPIDHHEANATNDKEQQTSIFEIYKDGAETPYMTIAINGNTPLEEPVVIKELPVGTYKIVEKTDWSWRYDPDALERTETLEAGDDTAGVAFVNTRVADGNADPGWKWLNGGAYNENAFNAYGN